MIRQVGKSVVFTLCLVILTLGCGLAAGTIWASIDWMKSFDSSALILPFSKLPGEYTSLDTTYGATPSFATSVQSFVQWHNLSFPGASRFGSGIAFILVPPLLLVWAKERLSQRVLFLPALVGGAIVGSRSMLMLSSTPRFFIFGLVTGAVVTIFFVCRRQRQELPPLPEDIF
jgi:hypothetical protein